jgi:hypothetical protein
MIGLLATNELERVEKISALACFKFSSQHYRAEQTNAIKCVQNSGFVDRDLFPKYLRGSSIVTRPRSAVTNGSKKHFGMMICPKY